MVKEVSNWRWRMERQKWDAPLLEEELDLNNLVDFTGDETSTAETLEEAFELQGLELPRAWWKGARLIRSGLSLHDSNPALARSLIAKGLQEYDEQRSVVLSHVLQKFNSLLAKGDKTQARALLDELAPLEENFVYPEDLDEEYFPSHVDPPELSELNEKAEDLNRRINGMTKILKSETDQWGETRKVVQADLQEIADRLDALQDEANKSVESVAISFREQMGLSEPVGYWEKRADQHGIAKWLWLGVFIVLLISFLTAASLVIENNWEELRELEPGQLSLILFGVGIPVAVVLWFIRIVARIQRNEAVLHDDARERQTMMQAYISMLASGGMSADDRGHVLRAIFRPRHAETMDDGQVSPVGQIVNAFRDEPRKE